MCQRDDSTSNTAATTCRALLPRHPPDLRSGSVASLPRTSSTPPRTGERFSSRHSVALSHSRNACPLCLQASRSWRSRRPPGPPSLSQENAFLRSGVSAIPSVRCLVWSQGIQPYAVYLSQREFHVGVIDRAVGPTNFSHHSPFLHGSPVSSVRTATGRYDKMTHVTAPQTMIAATK